MKTATAKMAVSGKEMVSSELAPRMERFIAALIDYAIMLVASIPIAIVMWMTGLSSIPVIGPFLNGVVSIAAGVALFLALNFNLLRDNGQTIGKRMRNIRIIGRDDKLLDVQSLLLKRYVPVWAASMIPFGGILCLADALCIFRDSRACLHDDIAGTKVVVC